MIEWPTNTNEWLTMILMAIGAATILVAALQKTVDPLQAWAAKTRGETDDKIVAAFAHIVNVLARILQAVKVVAAALSARPSKAPAKDGKTKLGGPSGLVAVAMLGALCACATPLKTHAQTASMSGDVIDTIGAVIENEARLAEQQAVDSEPTRDGARAAVDLVRGRFRPVEAAYEALRVSHAEYVAAVRSAHKAGQENLDGARTKQLLDAWRAVVEVGKPLGLKLPSPPQALQTLVEGLGV